MDALARSLVCLDIMSPRLQLSEQVALGTGLKSTDFSVRAGTRSIGVQAVNKETASSGGSDLILQLAETLSASDVVKVSYSGTQVADGIGNTLAGFKSR